MSVTRTHTYTHAAMFEHGGGHRSAMPPTKSPEGNGESWRGVRIARKQPYGK